jgi:hypothetical protein
MDSLVAHMLQERSDSPSNDVSFISGGNDHGDPHWICLHVICRRNISA